MVNPEHSTKSEAIQLKFYKNQDVAIDAMVAAAKQRFGCEYKPDLTRIFFEENRRASINLISTTPYSKHPTIKGWWDGNNAGAELLPLQARQDLRPIFGLPDLDFNPADVKPGLPFTSTELKLVPKTPKQFDSPPTSLSKILKHTVYNQAYEGGINRGYSSFLWLVIKNLFSGKNPTKT